MNSAKQTGPLTVYQVQIVCVFKHTVYLFDRYNFAGMSLP